MSLGDLDGDGDVDAFVANFNGQPNRVWLNVGTPVQPVVIDIMPGEFPNEIDLDDDDLEVAVLTTANFDATTVDTSDLSNVRFGDVNLSARVSPSEFEFDDVDDDGDTDLVFEFDIEDTGVLVASSTEAELTAFTTGGTPIRGTDSVVIEDDEEDDEEDDAGHPGGPIDSYGFL